MKAMLQEDYGSIDALESKDIDRPEIGDREVLVRVHAAALNVGDVFGMTGPLPMRWRPGFGDQGTACRATILPAGRGGRTRRAEPARRR